MRRLLPCLACLAFAMPLLLLAQDPPPQRKGGGGGAPKNLKILTPDELRSGIMQKYRVALGQQCTFCHMPPPDFASDENPKKEIARHMIAMVKEINAKFPDGKEHVSCYTCHRGATIPLTAPAQ